MNKIDDNNNNNNNNNDDDINIKEDYYKVKKQFKERLEDPLL